MPVESECIDTSAADPEFFHERGGGEETMEGFGLKFLFYSRYKHVLTYK